MTTPVELEDAGRIGLQLWAAYSSVKTGQLHSEVKHVPASATTKMASMESSGIGPNVMTCECSMCCGAGLNSIPSPIGGKVVHVNLSGKLTEEEKHVVDQLKARDQEVRRHEQAHLMAAGQYAMGGPSYSFQIGPDGKRYAVGGEVKVDISEIEGDPEATLRKAQQLQRAALAPTEPSAADRQVAARAGQMAQEARQEIAEEQREKQSIDQKDKSGPNAKKDAGINDASAGESAGNEATLLTPSDQDKDSPTGNAASELDIDMYI